MIALFFCFHYPSFIIVVFIYLGFNEELTELDERMSKLKRQMTRLLNEVADDLGLDDKKVKLNHSSQQGYHFRVSRKDEKALRTASGYTSLETRKDGVRFTNSEVCLTLKSIE